MQKKVIRVLNLRGIATSGSFDLLRIAVMATSTPIIIFLAMLKNSIYLFIYSKKNILKGEAKESF